MTTNSDGLATRETLLGAGCERRYDVVDAGVLGRVRIQSLSERELAQYEIESVDPKTFAPCAKRLASARRRLLSLCIVDADGKRLFVAADLKQLQELDGAAATMLEAACRGLCGLERPDDKNEEIEELAKNSAETTDGDSPSD